MSDESERLEIEQRLEYLYQHPDEIEYHVYRGHSGPYTQWTNTSFLQQELWMMGITEKMEDFCQKLDAVQEDRRRLIEFVKCYDEWIKNPGDIGLAKKVKKARSQI